MNLATDHLLLAANFDFIEFVIVIVLMIMGGASQLLSSKPKAKPPVRPRPQGPPANPGAPGGQAGKPASLEESLRREVEEFMRRAQGREPAAPQAKRTQRPAPQRPPARTAKPAAPARPEPVRRLTDAPGAQTTARPPEAQRPAPLGAGVGQHVTQHLGGAQAIVTHAQHLGADVAQADERMVAHLQEKFAHQVGALQHQDTAQQRKATRSPAAQAIVDMLRQPGGIRNIVLAGEILRRPEDRW
jgi:hypothetical protein